MYGERLNVTGVSGTFTDGENVTGSGGGAGRLILANANHLYVATTTAFTTSSTITGSSSGATATFSAYGNMVSQVNTDGESITAVASGGTDLLDLTVADSSAYSADDFVVVTGTSNYNGRYFVDSIPNGTTIRVPTFTSNYDSETSEGDDNQFGSTETGSIALGDKDPSGLDGLQGVVTRTAGVKTVYDMDSSTRLLLQGSAFVDPEFYTLASARIDVYALEVLTGGFGQFGKITGQTSGGNNRYSRGLSLDLYGTGTGPTVERSALDGGDLVLMGGEYRTGHTMEIIAGGGSTIVATRSRLVSVYDDEIQIFRNIGANDDCRIYNCAYDAFYARGRLFSQNGLSTWSGSFENCIIQQRGGTFNNGLILRNVTLSNNTSTADFQFQGSSTTDRAQPVELYNVDKGTGLGKSHNANNSEGHLAIYQDVDFTVLDIDLTPVSGVKVLCRTTGSGNRVNSTRPDATVKFQNSVNYASLGASDAGHDLYSIITDGSGEASETILLGRFWDEDATAEVVLVDLYSISQTAGNDNYKFEFFQYGFGVGSLTLQIQNNEAKIIEQILAPDLLTTESDKSVVDAYLTTDDARELYDFADAYLYDNAAPGDLKIFGRASNQIDLSSVANSLVVDATAVAVGSLSGTTWTAKSSSYTGGATGSGTVTLANGAIISGGTFDNSNGIFIDSNSSGDTYTNITANKITHTGSGAVALTLDGSTVTEVEVTGGATLTLTLTNGSALPTLTETSGTITAVQTAAIAATALLDDTQVQLYNVTKDSEISLSTVSGGSGYSTTVDLQSAAVDAGDTLQIRAAHYDTSSGNVYDDLTIEFTISINGFSSSTAQSMCTICTAIDGLGTAYEGENVTGFSLDVANIEIDSSVTTIDGQKLATWLKHEIAKTSSGIRNYFGSVEAINLRNFRFKKGIEIDNTGAPAVWTGAAWVRTDGLTIVSSSSNTIQFDNGLISVPTAGAKDDEIDAIALAVDESAKSGTIIKNLGGVSLIT